MGTFKDTKEAEGRSFATITFLSNDLKGFSKKNLLVLFVYSVQQQFFIFELHAAYLPGQKACVPMCSLFICVSKGQALPLRVTAQK